LTGSVPSEIAAQWGTAEWQESCSLSASWENASGGYYMPRYLADNPSREKVLADRKAKSERQQRWLENTRNASSRQRRVSRTVY